MTTPPEHPQADILDYAQTIAKLAQRFDNMISVSENPALTADLQALKKDLYYQSPELLVRSFSVRVSTVLENHLGYPPAEGWPTQLINFYIQ